MGAQLASSNDELLPQKRRFTCPHSLLILRHMKILLSTTLLLVSLGLSQAQDAAKKAVCEFWAWLNVLAI